LPDRWSAWSAQCRSRGAEYFARVRAEDARGGFSPWSNVRRFRLKDNLPPGAPGLDGACRTVTYTPDPPTQLTVINPIDPEGEAVTLQLEIHFLDDDPDAVAPLITASVPMDTSAGTTVIPFDGSGLVDGNYRWRVRASDGELTSDWTGCDFIVLLPLDEGGCCRTGGPGDALPLAALVLLLAVRRRRRG
jgi:MYXO-CTERM domain-containing protein